MDHNMALLLAVLTLIAIVMLFVVASYGDDSKANHEQPRGIEFGTSSDKFQQKTKLDQLVRSVAELKQLFTPIFENTQRHERILSGAQSKGALGEQIVGEKLKDLPHAWWAHDVLLNGATVDFALRAPNERWVPIDSQWTATRLLDQVRRATSQSHRKAFRMQVEAEVKKRAIDARKYVDQDNTLGFCIVAVPDPIFELCVDIQAELTSFDIVLISHSLLIPYLLLIVKQFLKTAQASETLQDSHAYDRAVSQIEVIKKYIDKGVVPPLEKVKLQQTQQDRQNRGIKHVYASVDEIQSDLNIIQSGLNEIQSGLNVLKSRPNPIPNVEIGSIPKNLQRYLNLVRDGLLKGIAKQNGHTPDNANK